MDVTTTFALMLLLLAVGAGGVVLVTSGAGTVSRKRISAVAERAGGASGARSATDPNSQRRKNTQAALKDFEKQQAAHKKRRTMRQRIEQAGLTMTVRTFYTISAGAALAASIGCVIMHQSIFVAAAAALVFGVGVPRWILGYLRGRRLKKFTEGFANAIDVIVRSVKSGMPTMEALKIVAKEMPSPVGPEFTTLCEGMKIGVTLEQGLKRMVERIPTAEVSFFTIVMTIQQKSGGNLSEALTNLAGVLRDRKRLQGKIQAMSSEAKASAAIIGSLPPIVMLLVYWTTPDYIMILFHERLGNLMLAACVVWMTIGVLVMQKMINFKH
jgi:tight adherence protein B